MNDNDKRLLCEQLKILTGKTNETDWVRAKLLYNIKETLAYETEYQTWANFLEEIKEKDSARMMRNYKHYVVELEIPLDEVSRYCSYTMADEVRLVSTTPKLARQWLERARDSIREHLRQDLREEKTGVKLEDCKHEWLKKQVCNKCGDWEAIE